MRYKFGERNMNKTRKNLITWAYVLNLVAAGINIISLILSTIYIEKLYEFLELELAQNEIIYARIENITTYVIDIGLMLSAGICLVLSLKKHDTNYELSKKLFFAGLILNVLSSPISIASILLFIAHFKYMDIKVEQEEDDVVEIVDSEDEIKRKIEKLRKLKDQGVISEEEFNQEILKLL